LALENEVDIEGAYSYLQKCRSIITLGGSNNTISRISPLQRDQDLFKLSLAPITDAIRAYTIPSAEGELGDNDVIGDSVDGNLTTGVINSSVDLSSSSRNISLIGSSTPTTDISRVGLFSNRKTNLVGNDSNCVNFLFHGDWIAKNNFEDLVVAFATAFDGRKDVCLTIKTWTTNPNHEGRQHITDGLRSYLNKLSGITRPPIKVVFDDLTEMDEIALISGADVYVSASRGEAIDDYMLTAMEMGKLVIATTAGDHYNYINPTTSLVVNHTMKPIFDSGIPFHTSKMYWGSIDMKDLIDKLRDAYMSVKTHATGWLTKGAQEMARDYVDNDLAASRLAEIVRGESDQDINATKGQVVGSVH
jgi:glycosyltransferase involved in cell wall biosynthesis